MAKYVVVFSEQADTDLDKIKKFYATQIVSRIETVLLHRAEDVTRSRVKKLRGFKILYRLRVGDYRIFYQVQSDEVTILRVLSKDKNRSFTRSRKAMKTIPIYEAKNKLSKYVEICREEPVVITKNGQMKAFLVPYNEDEFAALMLQYSPSFRKIIEKAAASKVRVPLSEVKRRLAKRRS